VVAGAPGLPLAEAKAEGWRDPLTPDDARAALAIASEREHAFVVVKWFAGDWRRVKALVGSRFDQGGRAVPLAVGDALRLLVELHERRAELDGATRDFEREWGWGSPADFVARLDAGPPTARRRGVTGWPGWRTRPPPTGWTRRRRRSRRSRLRWTAS
jgi:hypothetical protein